MSAAESEFARGLRELYEEGNRAWNEGDIERAYQALGDDIEYELASTWPQSKPLRGRAEVVEFFKDFRETFPDAQAGPIEFVEISEHRGIVGFPVIGTGRTSGIRIEMEVWQVWELGEGGIPIRVKEYPDRAAALRATAELPPDVVERIRASNSAWHRRDIDAVLVPYSDEIEWDTRDAFPDGRLYKGVDAFRTNAEGVLDRWAEHRLEIEEILGVEGTATVIVRYRMTGRSRSGVPVDAPWVHVFDFERGEIVRARNFGSFDAAVEAVGPAKLSPLWRRAADLED